ncbi:pre-mRNA-splicing factor ISY1 homolog [Oscarella lobularis]|uniref:pre-mRNA-splicing factor ISY1 homolog n=1 Tax=Oscarella lobularis TaxID=121494 RepID=UPI0033135837
MARNSEKAMAMLNRWVAMKQNEGKVMKRPGLASKCTRLGDAERYRRDLVKEISQKISAVQNPGLGEYKLRDLNDTINRLLRLKRVWEYRIVELGGPDYKQSGAKMYDYEGREVPGSSGYKYFGAARDLPGVRELFETEPPPPPRKTRAELFRHVDADYFGYRDEDDGVIVQQEEEEEEKAIARAVKEWEVKKAQGEIRESSDEGEEEEDIYAKAAAESDEEGANKETEEEEEISGMKVPSQEEVEEILVRKRKQELLNKYASEQLISQGNEAKTLLGLE